MNFPFFWKFEFVGLLANWIQNLKKIKKFDFQILILFGFDVFAIQPNFVFRSIASRLCIFIMSLLLKLLGVVEVFTANQHKFLKLT